MREIAAEFARLFNDTTEIAATENVNVTNPIIVTTNETMNTKEPASNDVREPGNISVDYTIDNSALHINKIKRIPTYIYFQGLLC